MRKVTVANARGAEKSFLGPQQTRVELDAVPRRPSRLMHRRLSRIAIAVAALLLVSMMIWKSSRPIACIQVGKNREWRVLKTSFGTNHFLATEGLWKQSLRRVLPEAWQKPLGPWQGERFQTRYDALVVWIGEFNARTGQPQTASLATPETMLADGTSVSGLERRARGPVVILEFRWFNREARQIPFRVYGGPKPVAFTIPNPHRVPRAKWKPSPLPHTNPLPGTDVVLRGMKLVSSVSNYEAALSIRAVSDGRSGWVAWRMTAFDPTGNWIEGYRAQTWGRQPRIGLVPTRSASWKLLVEGHEYISAGLVTMPTTGSVVLPIDARARRAGVKFLMLMAGGVYQITNGVLCDRPLTASTNQRPLTFVQTRSGDTNWTLDANYFSPGILCVYEPSIEGQITSVRLRERLPFDGGRIFSSVTPLSTTDSRRMAAIYTPHLPVTATNLELEIIRALPPTEFFIATP